MLFDFLSKLGVEFPLLTQTCSPVSSTIGICCFEDIYEQSHHLILSGHTKQKSFHEAIFYLNVCVPALWLRVGTQTNIRSDQISFILQAKCLWIWSFECWELCELLKLNNCGCFSFSFSLVPFTLWFSSHLLFVVHEMWSNLVFNYKTNDYFFPFFGETIVL